MRVRASARVASDTFAVLRSVPLQKDHGGWKISGFDGDVHTTDSQERSRRPRAADA
jgi:hypothetical protein